MYITTTSVGVESIIINQINMTLESSRQIQIIEKTVEKINNGISSGKCTFHVNNISKDEDLSNRVSKHIRGCESKVITDNYQIVLKYTEEYESNTDMPENFIRWYFFLI